MENLKLFFKLLNVLTFYEVNYSIVRKLTFPGTYILILKVNTNISVRQWKIKKGFFVYVGSAKNGLSKRLCRHLKKKKTLFWHIDYFLDKKEVEIYKIYVSKKQIEKVTARFLEKLYYPVLNFGNSDDKGVKSHLFKVI